MKIFVRLASWLLVLAATLASINAQTDEAEAKKHYRVGLVALENNDLSVAADEFREALRLAPQNALVNYHLAVVFSKQDKPAEGLKVLKRAIQLGLPEKEASAADDLEAKLTYASKRQENLSLNWLQGSWGVSKSENNPGRVCTGDTTREWKLVLSSTDGETLRGRLIYSLNRRRMYVGTNPRGYCSDQYSWEDTWDAEIKKTESPGKANADFKYVGCGGDCEENGNHWNSWQSVIEKRGDNQIFVGGAENGTGSSLSILGRLR